MHHYNLTSKQSAQKIVGISVLSAIGLACNGLENEEKIIPNECWKDETYIAIISIRLSLRNRRWPFYTDRMH